MKISYADFARAAGITGGYLKTYIKRGKLIGDDENKTIDFKNPVNSAWITTRKAKGFQWDPMKFGEKGNYKKTVTIEEVPKEKTESKKGGNKKNDRTTTEEEDAEAKFRADQAKRIALRNEQKNQLDLDKAEIELKNKRLDFEKRSGNLVPVDAVQNLFRFATEQMFTLISQNNYSMANIYVEILGVDEKMLKEIQMKFDAMAVEIRQKYKDSLQEGLKEVIKEYKDLRARGEKR